MVTATVELSIGASRSVDGDGGDGLVKPSWCSASPSSSKTRGAGAVSRAVDTRPRCRSLSQLPSWDGNIKTVGIHSFDP